MQLGRRVATPHTLPLLLSHPCRSIDSTPRVPTSELLLEPCSSQQAPEIHNALLERGQRCLGACNLLFGHPIDVAPPDQQLARLFVPQYPQARLDRSQHLRRSLPSATRASVVPLHFLLNQRPQLLYA